MLKEQKNESISIIGIEDLDTSRTERQERIVGWNQKKIEKSKIMVVGAGALGNEIVKNLALLGAKCIYLVDYDKIVLSNLNRCIFFREQDSHRELYKVDAIIERIAEINKETRIKPIIEKIEHIDQEIYKQVDIVLGAVDNDAARVELNQKCWFNKLPFIDGSMHGFVGMIRDVIPPETACIECGFSKEDYFKIYKKDPCTGKNLNIKDPKIPAIATTSSIIAAMQVQEAIKIIHGIKNYRKDKKWSSLGIPLAGLAAYYNGITNTTQIYEMSKSKYCSTCSPLNDK